MGRKHIPIGDGTSTDTFPLLTLTGKAIDIAMGYYHALVLQEDGTSRFWGTIDGELGWVFLSFTWTPPQWGDFHFNFVAVDDQGLASVPLSAVYTVHVPYDSDNNGLPDWWELKYFGQLGNNPISSPEVVTPLHFFRIISRVMIRRIITAKAVRSSPQTLASSAETAKQALREPFFPIHSLSRLLTLREILWPMPRSCSQPPSVMV